MGSSTQQGSQSSTSSYSRGEVYCYSNGRCTDSMTVFDKLRDIDTIADPHRRIVEKEKLMNIIKK